MPRRLTLPALSLAAYLLIPALLLAQSVNRTALPIDVLYLVANNTIQTYDVDPSSGAATLYGTLVIPASSYSTPIFVPGTNDHYIYVLSTRATEGTTVFVYATDSHGAPQDPPVQTVAFNTAFWNFVIDPNGTLGYAAQALASSSQTSTAGIKGFALNPSTGILTPFPTLSAISYPPAGSICGPDNPFADPSFSLAGIYFNGTQLVDDWFCLGHDDSVGYYFTRSVDQETGALGPEVPTVGAGSSEGEYNGVTFTPTSILSFENYGYEGSPNELDVYWPNATLDFSCTTMLDACNDSGGIAADRTGKFIFFYTNTGATEVTRLNMNKKTIEPVGIPLPDTIDAFSLDDLLIYGSSTLSSNGQYVIPVYPFDPSTGLITNYGETITIPNQYSILIPALRY